MISDEDLTSDVEIEVAFEDIQENKRLVFFLLCVYTNTGSYSSSAFLGGKWRIYFTVLKHISGYYIRN